MQETDARKLCNKITQQRYSIETSQDHLKMSEFIHVDVLSKYATKIAISDCPVMQQLVTDMPINARPQELPR